MAKSKADNYNGSGMSKGAYAKFSAAKTQAFGLKKKAPKKAAVKKPVYKSGLLPSGQPRNYATSKKGTITSID